MDILRKYEAFHKEYCDESQQITCPEEKINFLESVIDILFDQNKCLIDTLVETRESTKYRCEELHKTIQKTASITCDIGNNMLRFENEANKFVNTNLPDLVQASEQILEYYLSNSPSEQNSSDSGFNESSYLQQYYDQKDIQTFDDRLTESICYDIVQDLIAIVETSDDLKSSSSTSLDDSDDYSADNKRVFSDSRLSERTYSYNELSKDSMLECLSLSDSLHDCNLQNREQIINLFHTFADELEHKSNRISELRFELSRLRLREQS